MFAVSQLTINASGAGIYTEEISCAGIGHFGKTETRAYRAPVMLLETKSRQVRVEEFEQLRLVS